MIDLGICPYSNAVYEGSQSSSGSRVFPAPLLLPLRFVGVEGVKSIDHNEGFAMEIFREESFDPVTKIRRGRVFTRRFQSPMKADWHVQDPLRLDLPTVEWAHGRAQTIGLITYVTDNLLDLRKPENVRHRPKVLLGWEDHCTLWQIVAIETPIRSGPFLTLKALYSLGDLPELIEDALPDPVRTALIEAWDKLDGTVNRLAPLEVIDRCRDFLSIVFGHLSGDTTRDLSVALNSYLLTKKGEDMHASAGRIVARLHSRGKPNEQKSKGVRAPTEADAQLALRSVGLILLDLDWAR